MLGVDGCEPPPPPPLVEGISESLDDGDDAVTEDVTADDVRYNESASPPFVIKTIERDIPAAESEAERLAKE
ncbi:unnamed protein product [Toxocara canis]|uniref:Secreted protein n=1 Tax=Toxocara canis TaxID=6265 RepID=A0A183U3B3_TOXCA|nr:unnamed protein product [Toxocara canis]